MSSRFKNKEQITKQFSSSLLSVEGITSQLKEMHEQMNSMNDSGEFQEVKSNHSVRLSYVSGQLAMIPKFLFRAEPRQKIAA